MTDCYLWSNLAGGLGISFCLGLIPPVYAQTVPQPSPPSATQLSPSETASMTNQSSRPGNIAQPTIESPGLVVGFSLGQLYTNNVRLAGPNQTKSSSFITQVEPFIRAAYSNPRFTGMLNYSLTGYLYRGQTHDHQVAQKLHATGTITLIPNHFFVDAMTSYQRQIINSALPSAPAVDSYFLTGNQANSAVGLVSPYWIQGLGALGTLRLRYSRGRVVYNDRGIPGQNALALARISNATSNGASFSITSPQSGLLRWNLSYAQQRIEPDQGSSTEFAAGKVGLGFQVSPNLTLLVDGGKENKFLPDGTVQRLRAPFWDAGFSWANSLDYFKVLVGHRFYGRSYLVSWTHQAARLVTTLSYRERPTNLNQTLLTQNPTQAIILPMSVPRIPSLTEIQPYLSKRATASITYTGVKDDITLTLYDENRRYFSGSRQSERLVDAQLTWVYQVGAFSTLTPTFGWQRYKLQNGQITYHYVWRISFTHRFDSQNTGRIGLANQFANVTNGIAGAHGYRAKAIFLQWTHTF